MAAAFSITVALGIKKRETSAKTAGDCGHNPGFGKTYSRPNTGKGAFSDFWVPLLILLLILILISSPSCIRIKSKIKITIKEENPKIRNAPHRQTVFPGAVRENGCHTIVTNQTLHCHITSIEIGEEIVHNNQKP
jgi:hypothetical protein